MQIGACNASERPVASSACPNPAGPRHAVANLNVANCTVCAGLHHPSPVGQQHPGLHGCWAAVTCRDTSDSLSRPKKAVPAEAGWEVHWLLGLFVALKAPQQPHRQKRMLEHQHGALVLSFLPVRLLGGFESHQMPAANLAFRRGSEEERH